MIRDSDIKEIPFFLVVLLIDLELFCAFRLATSAKLTDFVHFDISEEEVDGDAVARIFVDAARDGKSSSSSCFFSTRTDVFEDGNILLSVEVEEINVFFIVNGVAFVVDFCRLCRPGYSDSSNRAGLVTG